MADQPETPEIPPGEEAPQGAVPEAEVAVDEEAPQGAVPEAEVAVDDEAPPEENAAPAAEIDPGEAALNPDDVSAKAEEAVIAEMGEAASGEGGDELPGDIGNEDVEEPSMNFPNLDEPGLTAQPAEFPELKGKGPGGSGQNFDLLMDVKLPIAIELGRTTLAIADILALGSGSVVELDKLAGEPVDLLVNNKCIAQGEVVVVDENFGIRITSLVSPKERIASL